MLKVILTTVYIILVGTAALGQKRYKCEFVDTTSLSMSDTLIKSLKNSVDYNEDAVINEEIGRQMVMELLKNPLLMIQIRSVKAGNKSTIIRVDRNTREGQLSIETFDSLLYKNDEIFPDSASESGFAIIAIQLPRKIFKSTGNFYTILKYKCAEYRSTDSTARIWVTTELPGYINPGIRKGNIQGAVLGFELKSEVTITRCFLTRIEEDHK